jgi:hypothetical protein
VAAAVAAAFESAQSAVAEGQAEQKGAAADADQLAAHGRLPLSAEQQLRALAMRDVVAGWGKAVLTAAGAGQSPSLQVPSLEESEWSSFAGAAASLQWVVEAVARE